MLLLVVITPVIAGIVLELFAAMFPDSRFARWLKRLEIPTRVMLLGFPIFLLAAVIQLAQWLFRLWR